MQSGTLRKIKAPVICRPFCLVVMLRSCSSGTTVVYACGWLFAVGRRSFERLIRQESSLGMLGIFKNMVVLEIGIDRSFVPRAEKSAQATMQQLEAKIPERC